MPSEKPKKQSKPMDNLEKELEDTKLVKVDKSESYGEKQEGKLQKDLEGKANKEIFEKVVKFTNAAREQYGSVIKSVLIFGSAARGTMIKGSDADIWVVLDDTATKSSSDLNKINTHLYLIAQELKDLHIQTTTLTEFWQWMKLGSPELVNFLRYSLPIFDTGFIKPVKRMLEMGLIPPSEETIKLKSQASQIRLKKIELDMKSMVFELRYTALDICQAVIMHHYGKQPDAKDMPTFLDKLVKEKKLEREYVKKFEQLNKLWKDIDHGFVKDVDTKYLEKALVLSHEMFERMNKLLPKELQAEKIEKEKSD
jgi:predicted nucleotidyltransferase